MIYYKAGFKYQLTESYECHISFRPRNPIVTDLITLTTTGVFQIKQGYAWDGPSGPTIDFKNFMRASLIHDATYQLMRESHIPLTYREQSDRELRQNCIADGMWTFKAWVVYKAVQFGGRWTSRTQDRKPTLTAP